MKLIDLVIKETGELRQSIMILRHSPSDIKTIEKHGVSVEEFTYLQEFGDRYDFFNPKYPKVNIVVVIVGYQVYEVFRVLQVDDEGKLYALASEEYKKYENNRKNSSELGKHYRKFNIIPLASISKGLTVRGYVGRERSGTIIRNGYKMMDIIEIDQG